MTPGPTPQPGAPSVTLEQPTSEVDPDGTGQGSGGPRTVPFPAALSAARAFRSVAFVAGYVIASALAAVAAHLLGLVDLRSPAVAIAVLAVMTTAALAAMYLHLVRANRLTAGQLGFTRPSWRLLHLLWQLPVTVTCALVVQAVVLLAVTGSAVRDRGAGSGDPLSDLGQLPVALAVVAALIAVVITPVWEEALFRGALLPGLARRFGMPLAVLLSAAVFAAFHLAPIVMPYVFVLGLGLGFIRWFHRNLLASILVHMTNNGLSLLAVLFAATS